MAKGDVAVYHFVCEGHFKPVIEAGGISEVVEVTLKALEMSVRHVCYKGVIARCAVIRLVHVFDGPVFELREEYFERRTVVCWDVLSKLL